MAEKYLSIEQATNKLRKDAAEFDKSKVLPNFAPTVTSSDKQKKYLQYCFGLCKDRKTELVLTLIKIYGYSHE